jgi:Alpha-L-arabinofuranosidase B (ABFB) domain
METDSAVPDPVNYRIRTSYTETSVSFYVVNCVQAGTTTRLNETDHITPPGDFLFHIKPGLANPSDPSLVSFESVSKPGYYLRIDSEHTNETRPVTTGAYAWALNSKTYDHTVWFDAFADTTAFKADATFKRVAALNGDPTMSSLQWYADETRYLRQAFYHLFALPPTTEQDNTDSSFVPGVSYRIKTTYSEETVPFYAVDCVQAGTITRLNETDHVTPADFLIHMRPGLADPNDPTLVSFESDSNPGYYLRIDSANPSSEQRSVLPNAGAYAWALNRSGQTYDHLTWFDLFADTTAFRNDATFKKTAALNGDATMSSLQWYNDSTRYLRHADYHLFALPSENDQQNTDSSFTFEVVQP